MTVLILLWRSGVGIIGREGKGEHHQEEMLVAWRSLAAELAHLGPAKFVADHWSVAMRAGCSGT